MSDPVSYLEAMTPKQPVSPTLAVFPVRPTKEQMLEVLMGLLEDFGAVYDAVDRGDENMVLGPELLMALGRGQTRAAAVRGALGSIAYVAAKQLSTWGPPE